MSSSESCDGSAEFLKFADMLTRLRDEKKITPQQYNAIYPAVRRYLEDCSYCKRYGENASSCHNQALLNLFRSMPFIHQSVYPWVNYDWDYGSFINNNYSAQATGSDSKGDMFRNFGIFFKLMDAYLFAPNPNSASIAGGTDSNSDFSVYGCQGNNRTQCLATNYVRTREPLPAPYSDPFFQQQPLRGEGASSYYMKVGYCPRADKKTKADCETKGYEWTPSKNTKNPETDGSCSQPRYAYLNNSPGLELNPIPGTPSLKLKGYFPSLANDFLSLTPEKLLLSMTGHNVPGHLVVQPCPENGKPPEEGFLVSTEPEPWNVPLPLSLQKQNESWSAIFGVLVAIVVIMVMLFVIVYRRFYA